MEISTASLLANQLQTLDPKANAKESATKIIQEHAKELPFLTSPQKSIPNNAQEVIGTLLGAAVSEAKSKSAIFEILQNHQLFKNMGNFAEDIKTLPSLIKPDAITTKPLALLELFTKNIQMIDGKVLAQQVNHSGIFFESKLAQEATQKGVETLLKELTNNIQTLLKETTQANASIPRDIAPLLEQLSQTSSLSTKESQEGLKQLLELFRQNIKQEQALVPSGSFKEVYTNVQKLDYALKQMDLIGSKVQNYPASMNVEQNFTTQVKVLLELIKEQLPALNLKEIQPQVDQLLAKESLLKSSLELLTPVEKEVTVQPLPSEIKESMAQTIVMPSSLSPSVSQLPQTVEEALQLVVNRLKAQIELMEPTTIKHTDFLEKAKVLEKEIHALIKPELFVGKAMAQKLSLDPTDVELLSDMKGVLTKLNHSLSLSGQNKEALEITNRLLTQIEYHQLVSYVSSSTHLYIPFSWDGLKGGSMMMKKSSDEQFHCQLDLDLEAYGKLNMMLILSNEKYIDMTIATQKKELSDKLTHHLSLLKRAFNEVGLITGNVKMLEYKDVERVKKDYFKGEELQFGINITI